MSSSSKNLSLSSSYIEALIKLTDPEEDLITFSNSSPPTPRLDTCEDLITFSDSSNQSESGESTSNKEVTSKTSEELPAPITTQVIKEPTESALDSDKELPRDHEFENALIWSPSIMQTQTRTEIPRFILQHPIPTQPSLKELKITINNKQESIIVTSERYFNKLKGLFYIKPRLNSYNQNLLGYAALHSLNDTKSQYINHLFNQKRLTTAIFQYYFPIANNWVFTELEDKLGYLLQHLVFNDFKTKVIVQICDNYYTAVNHTYNIKKTLNSGVFIIFINKYSIAFFEYSSRYKKGLFPNTDIDALKDLRPLNIFNLTEYELKLLKVNYIYIKNIFVGFSWVIDNPLHIPYIHACFKSIFNSQKLFI
uniref:Uncharacterized protein n=1 Tax=Orbilia brochopaga TaxID=3140254 RepID=A0A481ZLI2_9PEZI|nr:hypothetical protein [Drechslerella brochopaga]QBL02514.1 hypothetical protein [Drechslerella brochopaga]